MSEEHRHTDQMILDEIASMRKSFEEFKEDVNSRLAPLDKLRGFWSVMGFFLGALTVISAAIAGGSYLLKLFRGF